MKPSHNIPSPRNGAFLHQLLKSTPARIGVWRSGTRPLTCDLLKFRADHAAAQDAVNGKVAIEILEEQGLPVLRTMVSCKEEYLTRPDLGRKMSVEGKAYLRQNIKGKKPVQVVISDGLSCQAIEANIPDFLPAFLQGLLFYGIECHQPVFVEYGRVRLLEDIATAIDADVFVILVGERPGLVTAKSMSAYLVYRPAVGTVDADYMVLSNIHIGGTPPAEAAAYLARMVQQVLEAKASGLNFKQQNSGENFDVR